MKRNNEHNEFVGNFDSFFDNESSLTGGVDFGRDLGSPISLPSSPMPPRTPRNLTLAGPKTLLSPAVAFVLDNTPKYRCKVTPPYYVRDDINGTVLDYTKCPKKTVGVVSTGPQTPPSSGSGSGGNGATTGGAGGGGTVSDTLSTSSNESETATEQKPISEVKKTEIEKESDCKINHVLIFGFLVIGVIIAYFIAKKIKKDEFIFGITGGFVGAIIGYLYSKNKCK